MNMNGIAYHHSRFEQYRSPQGAIPLGQSVCLSVECEGSRPKLVVIGRENITLETCKAKPSANGDVWSVEYCPDAVGVYYYYFILEDNRFLGCEQGTNSGAGKLYSQPCPAWQLTVYATDYRTPDWFKNSVVYQIFPDRFFNGDDAVSQKGIAYHRALGRNAVEREWGLQPVYQPMFGEFYEPCDYYGGNLAGILQKLPYLSDMGVTCLYLNPVFESASNHGYNTGDYMMIDPTLGANEDFENLCAQAKVHGIRIILDGVFSHTGDDSIYFNRYGCYAALGAYQSTQSSYFPWYDFQEYPEQYRSWWGFKSLPEVKEENPDWQRYIIQNEDSVMKRWIKNGISGWRLDVADELPDDVIERMREGIKQADPDALLLGEVWEDATNKFGFGGRRTYALGNGLDSVMNYPLRNMIVSFLTGNLTAHGFCHEYLQLCENYPQDLFFATLNLLSSHDVIRVPNALAGYPNPPNLSRDEQAGIQLSDEQARLAYERQRLAALMVFSLPGAPCVYYGDEICMQGMMDPFNRASYDWNKRSPMREWYKRLADTRNAHAALRTGGVAVFPCDADVTAVLRCINDRDAFGNICPRELFFAFINRGAARTVALDINNRFEGVYSDMFLNLRPKSIKLLEGECAMFYNILEAKLTERGCAWGYMELI